MNNANKGAAAAQQYINFCKTTTDLINSGSNSTENKNELNETMKLLPTCANLKLLIMENEALKRKLQIRSWIDAARKIVTENLNIKFPHILQLIKSEFGVVTDQVFYHQWISFCKSCNHSNKALSKVIINGIVAIVQIEFQLTYCKWLDVNKYYSEKSGEFHERTNQDLNEINACVDDCITDICLNITMKKLFNKVNENDRK